MNSKRWDIVAITLKFMSHPSNPDCLNSVLTLIPGFVNASQCLALLLGGKSCIFSRWKDPGHDTVLQTSRTRSIKTYLMRKRDISPPSK